VAERIQNKKTVDPVESAHGLKKLTYIIPAGLRADFTALVVPPPPVPGCQLIFAHATFFSQRRFLLL